MKIKTAIYQLARIDDTESNAFHGAVRDIQDLLDVTDGGFASLAFSDDKAWANSATRIPTIIEYVRREVAYMVDPVGDSDANKLIANRLLAMGAYFASTGGGCCGYGFDIGTDGGQILVGDSDGDVDFIGSLAVGIQIGFTVTPQDGWCDESYNAEFSSIEAMFAALAVAIKKHGLTPKGNDHIFDLLVAAGARRCGLNASWSVRALQITEGELNRVDGATYLVENEDDAFENGEHSWSVVTRKFNPDCDTAIEPDGNDLILTKDTGTLERLAWTTMKVQVG